jgi:hypothetical protein
MFYRTPSPSGQFLVFVTEFMLFRLNFLLFFQPVPVRMRSHHLRVQERAGEASPRVQPDLRQYLGYNYLQKVLSTAKVSCSTVQADLPTTALASNLLGLKALS